MAEKVCDRRAKIVKAIWGLLMNMGGSLNLIGYKKRCFYICNMQKDGWIYVTSQWTFWN